MSRLALACVAACALVAVVVPSHRPGAALALGLLLLLATVVATGPRATEDDAHGHGQRLERRMLGPTLLAVALAVQPALRDAGPVVAVGVVGALAATAWAATPLRGWRALARTLVAPVRLDAGALLLGRLLAPAGQRLAGVAAPTAVLRAGVAALAVGGAFVLLLMGADEAFADLLRGALRTPVDVDRWTIHLLAAGVGTLLAGALAFARLRPPAEEVAGPPLPRTEARAVLWTLVAVFAVFVAVQLRVLFGGAAYVRETTGLGLGEYARHGFVALLVAAALTLVVVALGARRRDLATRAALGLLCGLTLVMLASAWVRLELVSDAYGPTRVRVGGQVAVLWLAAVFVVVLGAGPSRRVAARVPPVLAAVSLLAALGFCVLDPDKRIAESAAAREEPDLAYLAGLSADALPALDRLADPRPAARVRARLRRPDGVPGFNLARHRAR